MRTVESEVRDQLWDITSWGLAKQIPNDLWNNIVEEIWNAVEFRIDRIADQILEEIDLIMDP